MQRKQEDDDDLDDDRNGDDAKTKVARGGATSASGHVNTSYYDYLINMSLRNLTKERRDDIIKEQQEKRDKLEALKKKSPEDLFEDDLVNFEMEYRKVCRDR